MAKHTTLEHPKNKRLARRLGTVPGVTLGLLETVWGFACAYAIDGRLTGQDLDDALDGGRWFTLWDFEVIVDALIDTGWLDKEGEILVIHDWFDHCPEYVKKRARRSGVENAPVEPERRANPRSSTPNGGQNPKVPPQMADGVRQNAPNPEDLSGSRRTKARNSGDLSSLTRAETQPNPTQPNQTLTGSTAQTGNGRLRRPPKAGTDPALAKAREEALARQGLEIGQPDPPELPPPTGGGASAPVCVSPSDPAGPNPDPERLVRRLTGKLAGGDYDDPDKQARIRAQAAALRGET